MKEYLSMDHEILTNDGWKWVRDITVNDDVFTITGQYVKPYSIDIIQNNTYPLVNVYNHQINAFGTPELKLYIPNSTTPNSISLYDIHNHNNKNDIDICHIASNNSNKKCVELNDYDKGNKTQIDYITKHNKFALLKQDMSKVDYHSRYVVTVYDHYYSYDDVVQSESILLCNTKGTSIVRIHMCCKNSTMIPICVRRNGCVTWILQ